jgi:glutamate N-acetyltransferase / amino-acid N-acetyltransferase
LAAIIKGSGMIAPDMATMLGYIFTDARLRRFPAGLPVGANQRTSQLHHGR